MIWCFGFFFFLESLNDLWWGVQQRDDALASRDDVQKLGSIPTLTRHGYTAINILMGQDKHKICYLKIARCLYLFKEWITQCPRVFFCVFMQGFDARFLWVKYHKSTIIVFVILTFPILHGTEMWKRGHNNLIRDALVFIPFKVGKW